MLPDIARREVLERGLHPDFSTAALTELGKLQAPIMEESITDGSGHLFRVLSNLMKIKLLQRRISELSSKWSGSRRKVWYNIAITDSRFA
jgi:hypothetical protein